MEAFYRSVFELPVLERWRDEKGSERSVWLGLDGAFLALEKLPAGSPRGQPGAFTDAESGYYVFAVRIERSERSAWEARLERAGIPIERRTPFSLFFRDPEGNRLAVSHHPEAAS